MWSIDVVVRVLGGIASLVVDWVVWSVVVGCFVVRCLVVSMAVVLISSHLVSHIVDIVWERVVVMGDVIVLVFDNVVVDILVRWAAVLISSHLWLHIID